MVTTLQEVRDHTGAVTHRRLINIGCAHPQRRTTRAVTAAIGRGHGRRWLRAPDKKHPLHHFVTTTTCAKCDELLSYTLAR